MACTSQTDAFRRPLSLAFTLALLLGIFSVTRSHAANLRKLYPELAERKASLDSVALVVDAIETEDVSEAVEDVLITDSRGYAEQAVQLFVAELKRKRFAIRRSAVLTLGALVDPGKPFRCPDKTKPAHTDASGFFVAASADTTELFAPFFTDSSVLGDAEALAGWRSMLAAVATATRHPGDSIIVMPAAIALGARLGCDALAIVSVQSHTVPGGRVATAPVPVGGVGVGISYKTLIGSATIELAVFDAHDGRLLWADSRFTPTLSHESLNFRAPDMVRSLP